MGKYGKKFRKIQIGEWKEKYFNYKSYKQKIKSLLNEKNKEEFITKSDNEKEEILGSWTFKFEESLDKDIKKIYIFFSNKERALYKKINKLLHMKSEYSNFDLSDYLNQYKEIYELSVLSLNISDFIYYNLKAIMKILKKYDKKIIGAEFKQSQIKISYIQAKLEEQNSDILYLIKFKMIDEINLILESLIKSLKEQFKLNKNKIYSNAQNGMENKLIDELPEINQAENLIKQNHDNIQINIKKIDKNIAKVTALFLPWKKFLRISSDLNSKLLQITKENSMSMNESINTIMKKSIAETMNFSKETKYNIFIILSHAFLYMGSFSIIIPSYTSIFVKMRQDDVKYIWWGLLMMMVPLASLFSYIYEILFFKRSTKMPIILSCFGLMLGNILYTFAPYFDIFVFLFIGRFIVGLFNIRAHNKMYIMNFLLQKDISFYLTMFHTFSMIGLGIGFIINTVLILKEFEISIFNLYNLGPFFFGVISFILFILTIILFTEAHSKYFNMTSLQNFGEEFLNDNNDELAYGEINNANTVLPDNIEKEVKRQSTLLKNINAQLGKYNRKSMFDDTNLVIKSINELTKNEEFDLNYLLNPFIAYLIIIFTTKFINESIYLNAFIFIKNNENPTPWKIPLALGCSCFISLFIELSLSCKDAFIAEKNLLIILLIFLFLDNGLIICFNFLKIDFFYIFVLDSVLANLTEKYAAHLFLYIIPENYNLCKLHGNIFINIFSMISRFLCSCFIILVELIQIDIYELIIFIIMTSLSFVSLIFYLILYQDIRVKSIRRIMKENIKDEVKVATEI